MIKSGSGETMARLDHHPYRPNPLDPLISPPPRRSLRSPSAGDTILPPELSLLTLTSHFSIRGLHRHIAIKRHARSMLGITKDSASSSNPHPLRLHLAPSFQPHPASLFPSSSTLIDFKTRDEAICPPFRAQSRTARGAGGYIKSGWKVERSGKVTPTWISIRRNNRLHRKEPLGIRVRQGCQLYGRQSSRHQTRSYHGLGSLHSSPLPPLIQLDPHEGSNSTRRDPLTYFHFIESPFPLNLDPHSVDWHEPSYST